MGGVGAVGGGGRAPTPFAFSHSLSPVVRRPLSVARRPSSGPSGSGPFSSSPIRRPSSVGRDPSFSPPDPGFVCSSSSLSPVGCRLLSVARRPSSGLSGLSGPVFAVSGFGVGLGLTLNHSPHKPQNSPSSPLVKFLPAQFSRGGGTSKLSKGGGGISGGGVLTHASRSSSDTGICIQGGGWGVS